MQLIVLGMHRSGTSAVTRLLNMAGAYFGPEDASTGVNEENPKGFWERRDVRLVCDGLLQDSGFDWWKVDGLDVTTLDPAVTRPHLERMAEIVHNLDAHRPWVVKEPRLCLLFPVVRPLLEVPVAVHVTREPLEVAASLANRNGFPVAAALALWERYTLESVRGSAEVPRVHLRYEDVLAEPAAVLGTLLDELEALGVNGLRRPSEREITAFVVDDLHRHRREVDTRRELLTPSQAALAAATDAGELLGGDWDDVALSEGAAAAQRDLEAARAEVAELEERIRAAHRQAEALVEAEKAATEQAAAEARRTGEQLDRLERDVTEAVATAEARVRALGRSTSWRLLQGARDLRHLEAPAGRTEAKGRVARIQADLRDVHSTLEAAVAAARPTGVPTGAEVEVLPRGLQVRRTGTVAPRSERRRVAVLAWDVGHNPLGRAFILAELLQRRFDVELWGAQFERYGSRTWAPLQGVDLPIHSFDGRPFPEHLDAMEQVAERLDVDAIWVSKPRLPSLGLGVLAKRHRNRPLVLDVDDHELAFFAEDEGLDLAALRHLPGDDLALPFERAWTRACDPLIAEADAVTVSNAALRDRYGGTLVPHARDETRFDPDRYDRDETRARLGVGPEDRLLLFGGTPRVHKGVVEVLEALERLGDARCKLALFGTRELDELRDVIGPLSRWVLPLPYHRFHDLAPIVGAADLACVLQDPSHPVSRYQMPAKVTDALAMGVPLLVRDTPPLQSLVEADVVSVHDDAVPLHERLAALLEGDEATDRARRGRKLFLEEYSYEAVCDRIAPLFDELLDAPAPPLSPTLAELVVAPRRLTGPGGVAATPDLPARVPGSRRWDATPGEQYDLVLFWKQNDTSIYGRRSDMFLEYLRRSGRFATIVHFDSPLTPEELVRTYRRGAAPADQGRLVVRQTMERLTHRRDGDGVVHRTFLYAGRTSRRLGLKPRDDYHRYVRSVLDRHGVGQRRLTVFWVWPTNYDFPAVADMLAPDLVVADVVDDNRTWYERSDPMYDRVERNYEEILGRADLVIANCEPVVASMQRFAPGIHLVANGCELPDAAAGSAGPTSWDEPWAQGTAPVIGYVGNLSARLDVDLLDGLARARPDWRFVLIGSAHLDQSILRLDRHENVHFAGVRPYTEVKHLVRRFDVALIPHLDNDMTRSMNPLKAFVYAAAGVPIVSTPIANLDEVGSLITVAEGVDGFVAAIESALVTGHEPPPLDVLEPHSWERRVADTLALLDRAAGLS